MEHLKIAIADDNQKILDLLDRVIGMEKDMNLVGKAKNGEEMCQIIKDKQPDVVLLDLIMPKMDGLTVMDRINHDKTVSKHPYFIVITAVGQEKITEDAFNKGANYYMMKPFQNEMLLERIRSAGRMSHGMEIRSSEAASDNRGESLETRVTNMLHEIGIPAHIKGYHYLRDAIMMAVDDMDAAADGIIVAADTKVDMPRFDGKPVVQTQVSDGISRPQELIQTILDGKAPVFHAQGGHAQAETGTAKEGLGHQIYKHLMNGVSNMLPFVIGGGILIAIAFLLDTILAPGGDPANFGMNSPAAALFKTIGNAAFGFMLPILAGFISMSIADRPGLAVGFVGGALANAGGSGFLGALIAGFIAGYLMLGLEKLCAKLPKSLEGTKPVLIYPVVGILAIGVIIQFIINPPVSALNLWISNALASLNATSGVILGAIVGGMMSIDMGGPFNKAAYVFGTASLINAAGDPVSSGVMAAVMIGGMVPPLAVALCTTFFKNRFTEKERQTTVTNYIMGFSFITEGVIPFAASDPLRVIPSCVVGSAVAGALSMLFGCTLPAPHGGIFVFAVVQNWPMYLVSLLIGSVVAMLLLALLKKPIKEGR